MLILHHALKESRIERLKGQAPSLPFLIAFPEVMIDLARFTYEHTLEAGIYTVNIIWPLSSRIDSWFEHLEYGDRRALSATEYTPHR